MIVVVTTLLRLHFRLILERSPPTVADAMIVAAVVSMIAFVVIDNGLLRGNGTNRHGPDPLRPRSMRPHRTKETSRMPFDPRDPVALTAALIRCRA